MSSRALDRGRNDRGRGSGAADVEITSDWATFAHWTPAQRALKIELDGERRQAEQVAESTGRLVSRLVAEMVASAGTGSPVLEGA